MVSENNSMKNTTSYRMVLYIPVDLELKARKKAYDMGYVRANRGVLSNYIQLLVIDDIREGGELKKVKNIDYGKMNRVNITLDPSLRESMVNRARELGFIKGGKGNVSGYIRYLLAKK